MDISKIFTQYMLDPKPEYSEDLNNFINMHNMSVSELAQSMLHTALLSVLIEKGLITEKELEDAFINRIDTAEELVTLKKNYESIQNCIEFETNQK